jgi:putative MATE family efflux protein
MTTTNSKNIFSLLKESLTSENQDFTQGSINKAIVMLAIPMILEMFMESLFGIVDIFFVSQLGNEAVSTVGLTESMLTIVYSVAIGISMAATAIVARRVGEKNYREASKAGAQAMVIGLTVSLIVSSIGFMFAKDLLQLMGATPAVIATGITFTKIALGGNIVIMMLFLINGIFRGAGNASIAFKSLLVANISNIILCPLLIKGLGPIPALGLKGAALATLIGRSIGVLYQLYHLTNDSGIIKIKIKDYIPNLVQIKAILDIAWSATLQFIIASGSWIFMVKIIASFGEAAITAYTLAIRVMLFFIMPAWGLSNAAATLVGQNLGAQQPDRAEKSVWQTAKYSVFFMIGVTIFFLISAEFVLSFLTQDAVVLKIGALALRIMSIGYIFYGIGMVMVNSFNGAGDSKTPTIINFFGYWCFQIPLAWLLTHQLGFNQNSIFIAIVVAETLVAITGVIIFKRGHWKKIKV